MALSAVVSLSVAANIVNALAIGNTAANLANSYGTSLTNGTAAGQADKAWWSQRTLALSASETLDLAGVLLDQFGAAITFARVKVLVIAASAANTNNVVVGGGTTTLVGLLGATTHTAVLRPGTVLSWVTGMTDAIGYTVTSGSADLLQVANSGAGTSVTYDIAIIGCSV